MHRVCSVVIHSFNRRAFLARALTALEQERHELEVIVADSGSTDGSRDLVRTRFPWARLIEQPEDRGLAAGRNAGIRAAHGEFIIIMDEDVIVTRRQLATLIDVMRARPDAGVVTCCKVDRRGTALYRHHVPLPSSLTLPFFIILELAIAEMLRAAKAWLQIGEERPHQSAEIAEIPFVGGAFALVRADAIRQVGLLDEGVFFYGEDFDWWYRFRSAGWKLLYLPQVTVQAYRGTNSRRSRRASLVALQSRRYLFIKHVGGRALPIYVVAALSGLIPRTAYYLVQSLRGRGDRSDISVREWLGSALRVIAGLQPRLTLRAPRAGDNLQRVCEGSP